ncbi:deoxyribodipyrimidine photo-lyase [Halonotius sp. GCM10025705]|uniref:deoxyribodipyrimidine photo-lyase n=1 Tax=Halonotius sp. GCM10025705 TaxID=3252678 RepID=UPI0036105969
MNAPSSAAQLSAVSQQVDGVDDVCLVWHCRNLRTDDHPAIEYATEQHAAILPVFIVDPAFYGADGLACDARIQFMLESLADLTDQYASLGGGLTMLHGEPVELLEELDAHVAHIVTTADPTGRYGLRRDNAVAEACDITFVDADGLRRDVPDTRDGWSDHVESYLTAPIHEVDGKEILIHDVDTGIDPAWVEDSYDISPEKQISRVGGTEHAVQVLNEFTAASRSIQGISQHRPMRAPEPVNSHHICGLAVFRCGRSTKPSTTHLEVDRPPRCSHPGSTGIATTIKNSPIGRAGWSRR